MNNLNELNLLFVSLLGTRKKPGKNSDELLRILQCDEEKLNFLIGILDSKLDELGLKIRLNPLSRKWFISINSELSQLMNDSILSTSAAATLYIILKYIIERNQAPSIEELKNLRKKKSVKDDIEELEENGLIENKDDKIILGTNFFYYIDLIETLTK